MIAGGETLEIVYHQVGCLTRSFYRRLKRFNILFLVLYKNIQPPFGFLLNFTL